MTHRSLPHPHRPRPRRRARDSGRRGAGRHPDASLVEAARRGDRAAVATLVEDSLPLVYNLVRRALDGGPEVDDVVQETMERVVRALPTLRDAHAFRPWLIAITVRRARDHRRSRSWHTVPWISLEDLRGTRDPALDFAGVTEHEVELSRQRAEVVEATRWLPEADRQVLELWWQEATGVITRSELAAASGRPVAHTAVRVQRVKARLALARIVLRALSPHHGCPDLRDRLPAGDARPDPALLGRLGRHVRRCERCQDLGRQLTPPEGLVTGVLVPVPVALLDQVLLHVGAEPVGVGAGAGPLALKPAAAIGSAVAAVGLAVGLTVHLMPAAPDPAPPAPRASSPAAVTPGGPRAVAAGVTSADLYVAPDGDDDGPGSRSRPFASLARAVAVVRPGQTVAVRGGRYRVTAPVLIETDGSARRPIRVSNYRGERPVFDLSALGADRGFIQQSADHWRVEGLELVNGARTPYLCRSCRANVFRRLSIHDNQATGLILRDEGTSDNRILDSDFHDNHDDARGGADADGLLFAYGSGRGNSVSGCRFHDNADDGLDVVKFDGALTIDGNWSFGNGVNRWGLPDFVGAGNGFRVGGGPSAHHRITGNAAWRNAGNGFDEGVSLGRVTLTGNSSVGNGKLGFSFGSSTATLSRNTSVGDGEPAVTGPRSTRDGNSWQAGATTAPVRAVDLTLAEAPRRPDGSLPPAPVRTGGG